MSETFIHSIKSAKKQYVIPVKGKLVGNIPKWINGSLYRNGPGKFEVGTDEYSHLFDGLAMIQRYQIKDGEVEFNSQYVQSNTYHRNMAANRIVVNEFGTVAFPDPCKSIFDRIASRFTMGEMTDNTSVTVYNLGDALFVASETNVIHRLDPEDLCTIGSVRLNKILAVHRATAHFHTESEKTYLLGFVNSPPSYAVVSLPSLHQADLDRLQGDKYGAENLLTEAKIEAQIPVRWKFNPSYSHSFGITENFFILIESPLTISISDMAKSKIRNLSFSNSFRWWNNEKTLIHVIDRKTGQPVLNKYLTEPFFTFHHINAFEDQGHVVVDFTSYPDGSPITLLHKSNMEKKDIEFPKAMPHRLVLPLDVNVEKGSEGIATLATSSCVYSVLQVDANSGAKTVHVSMEPLGDSDIELPTVNYEVFNGRSYRFSYGVTSTKMVKINVTTKETTFWAPETTAKITVNEAIFVVDPEADPSNADHEDYGVLLCPVIYHEKDERHQNLHVLDARTMQELGRAEFESVSIPMTFHGLFREKVAV